MNYLAHIYLSGENDQVKIGNFIADGIKGTKYKSYPNEIQIGILLHRKIDWFSDNNKVLRISKRRLNDQYGHYKGVIIDIFFDHFLAKNWENYADTSLTSYAQSFYSLLEDNRESLPERIKHLMTYMIRDDWLSNYANLRGIESVLNGMNRRTNYISNMDLSIKDLRDNYENFENDFKIFFEELCLFSEKTRNELHEKFN